MANLIRSLGYSIGKIHSGLIGYLCDLYRAGGREPLESFFGVLNVGVSFKPVPAREWNSVDLAILDEETERPRILIETKVDDHEGGTSSENYQTVRYVKAWPSCDSYLFITLGMGEYYHAPYSKRFSWVRIRDFLRALETIKARDNMVIRDWTEEVRREVRLQDAVLHGDRSQLCDYRAGSWNIYFLGQLAERIAPKLAAESIAAEPTCYTYGTRPDTILNFGWRCEPQYMEINYSGRLNLKLSLDGSESARRDAVAKAIEACRMANFYPTPTFHPTGKIGNSKTIASFEIGLKDTGNGALQYVRSADETERSLLSLLRTFYGTWDNTTALNQGMQPSSSAGG